MKTVSKVLLTVVAICFVNAVSFAKDSSQLSIQSVKKDVIAIQLSNTSPSQVQVSIKDAQGSTVFEETVLPPQINHRKYNLKLLPTGTYTLHIEYDNVIKIKKVIKKFNNVDLASGNFQTIYKPTFNVHSNYVDLTMKRSDNQKISIEIRDTNGNTIFTEKEQPQGSILKRFNLSQLEEGAYNFYIEVNGIIFNKEFSQAVNWSPSIAGL